MSGDRVHLVSAHGSTSPGPLAANASVQCAGRVKKFVTDLRFRHAQAALLAHDWPGNVRKLEHLVGRSVLKALAGMSGRPRPVDLRTSMESHQRQRMEASLARHHNNWASAARELGLHRANLVRLAKRLGLRGEAGSLPDRLHPAVQNPPKQGV